MKKQPKLPQKEFSNGFETLMDLLYFQCNKEYYQQINDLPMGLSVSPIIVDIVLQDPEEEFL